MIDKYEDFNSYFTFSCTDEDGSNKSLSKSYEEGVMWTEVLNDFVDYLSYVYGYNLKDKVRVESPFWMQRGFDVDNTRGWQGEFFDPDKEPKKD
jgi:hypothetical protein